MWLAGLRSTSSDDSDDAGTSSSSSSYSVDGQDAPWKGEVRENKGGWSERSGRLGEGIYG